MVDHTVLLFSLNQGRYLASCIESLLEQTQRPDEIIVYDAGSDDGSVDILNRYSSDIRVITGDLTQLEPNIAEAQGLQTAFGYSRGRLIFLLEACDRFKPGKVDEYSAAFDRRPDASMVQAPLDLIDDDGNLHGTLFEQSYHAANHLREIYRRQDVNLFYPTSALAFSRHYIERVLSFELDDGLPLWTDARLCVPAAYFGHVVTLPEPLTQRRQHRGRMDQMSDLQHVRETLLRIRMFNTFCRRHGLVRLSPWRNRLLYAQLLRWMLPTSGYPAFGRRVPPAIHRA